MWVLQHVWGGVRGKELESSMAIYFVLRQSCWLFLRWFCFHTLPYETAYLRTQESSPVSVSQLTTGTLNLQMHDTAAFHMGFRDQTQLSGWPCKPYVYPLRQHFCSIYFYFLLKLPTFCMCKSNKVKEKMHTELYHTTVQKHIRMFNHTLN